MRWCRSRLPRRLKLRPHCGHWCGRSPVCTSWWRSRERECVNRFPQSSQRWGCSPASTHSWLFKLQAWLKARPHAEHWKRSSASGHTCSASSDAELKPPPHWGQKCSKSSPSCPDSSPSSSPWLPGHISAGLASWVEGAGSCWELHKPSNPINSTLLLLSTALDGLVSADSASSLSRSTFKAVSRPLNSSLLFVGSADRPGCSHTSPTADPGPVETGSKSSEHRMTSNVRTVKSSGSMYLIWVSIYLFIYHLTLLGHCD